MAERGDTDDLSPAVLAAYGQIADEARLALETVAARLGETRHAQRSALGAIEDRLADLYDDATAVRPRIPAAFVPAFARIEQSLAQLSQSIAAPYVAPATAPASISSAQAPDDRSPTPPDQPAAAIAAEPAPAIAEDRAWLEARFADIAARLEASLADIRPEQTLPALDTRFGELERHLSAALEGVATRADIAGLRLIEVHVRELTRQIGDMRAQVARVEDVEMLVASLSRRLSDERVAALLDRDQASQPDLGALASDVAQRVVHSLREQPGGRDPATRTPEALSDLITAFMKEKRQGDAQLTHVLGTIQTTTQRILDRFEPAAPRPDAPAAQSAPAAIDPGPLAADSIDAAPITLPPERRRNATREELTASARRAAQQAASARPAERTAPVRSTSPELSAAHADRRSASRAARVPPRSAGAGTLALATPAGIALTALLLVAGAAAVIWRTTGTLDGSTSQPPMETAAPLTVPSTPSPALDVARRTAHSEQNGTQVAPAPVHDAALRRLNGRGETSAVTDDEDAKAAGLPASAGVSPHQTGSIAPVAAPPRPDTETPAWDLPPATIGPNSLRVAAGRGDPSAAFEIGARFADGRGVPADFKQAAIWYQRAASRGFAPAQYRLGTLTERGLGTPADLGRARSLYRKAAEQGHVKAMHNLAVLTASGDAGPADYATAAQWFEQAAQRGLADSQFNLGVLYEKGLGVPQSLEQAYIWVALAARSGDKDAERRRDRIRAQIGPARAAAADRQIGAWTAKPTDAALNDPRMAGEMWKARAVEDAG